jgi:hypothetical protein
MKRMLGGARCNGSLDCWNCNNRYLLFAEAFFTGFGLELGSVSVFVLVGFFCFGFGFYIYILYYFLVSILN